MGRHHAEEPAPTVEIAAVKKRTGLSRVYAEYCQPLYKRYRKFIVAALGAAITTFFAVWTDGITQEEWMFILIQAGAAAGVWGVPNATNKKVVKTDAKV